MKNQEDTRLRAIIFMRAGFQRVTKLRSPVTKLARGPCAPVRWAAARTRPRGSA